MIIEIENDKDRMEKMLFREKTNYHLFNFLSQLFRRMIHLWIASIENKEERQCEESKTGGGGGHVPYKHFFAISLTVQSKGMKGSLRDTT